MFYYCRTYWSRLRSGLNKSSSSSLRSCSRVCVECLSGKQNKPTLCKVTVTVEVCVFTAGPITKLCAWGEEVCFITAGPITKLFACGGRRVEDMCHERRRAEACVDVGPVRNPVL